MPYSLEQDIAVAADAGFDGIELWWPKVQTFLENKSRDKLEGLLAEHKLPPVALCPLRIRPFQDTGEARESFDLAVGVAPVIGCSVFIVCPEQYPDTISRDEALSLTAQEVKRFAEKAATNDIRLAIEPIGRHNLIPGPRQALELMELAGAPENLGLMMDTFHYYKSEIPNEDLEAVPIEKLYIVHINDSEDHPRDQLIDAHRLYPTLGVIPLKEKLIILKKKKYDGYLSLEIFRPSYWQEKPEKIVKEGLRYLRQLVAEVE
jgi:2-keto-myo-inositol isomerase